VGGYYLVFWGMEQQAKQNLLGRLEANSYSENELVVLTIPLSLPYPVTGNEYENVEGEFVHEGQYYKLVKQKFENDTLFIVCIQDNATSKLSKGLADYSKVANNLPVGSKQAMNFLAKLYKEYKTSEFRYFYVSRFLYEQNFVATQSDKIIERTSPVESPPPEMKS
jgi:hypothetical protein